MDLRVVRRALHKEPFEIRDAARPRPSPHRPTVEFVAIGKRRVVVIEPGDSWSIHEPLMIDSLDQMKAKPPGDNAENTDKRISA